MKYKIINKVLLVSVISTQFAPMVANAESVSTYANGLTEYGAQNPSDLGQASYAQPNEAYEDSLKDIKGIAGTNSKFHYVEPEVDLINTALDSITATEGIVANNNQTQDEVNANTTWYGDLWQNTNYDGDANADNKKTIKTKTSDGSQYVVIKDAGTYFNLETGESYPVNLKFTVDYVDFTRDNGSNGVDVSVTSSGISVNKAGTDELQFSYEYTSSETGEEVNAPVLYSFVDLDNTGNLGMIEDDIIGIWGYYDSTPNSTYSKDSDTFDYNAYYDWVMSQSFTQSQIESGTRYYNRNGDRTKYNSPNTPITGANGNITPAERGSQRLKYSTSSDGKYITMIDSWGTNTGNSGTEVGMDTNGKDGQIMYYGNSNTSFTAETISAYFNYDLGNASGDTISINPYNVAPIVSANSTYEENEHITHTDAELIDLYDVFYNSMPNSEIIVDQSAIDYETPGTYPISFTHQYTDGTKPFTVNATYTVIDVLPTITATPEITVNLGSDVLDYVTAFNPVGTEFVSGDITSTVSVTPDTGLVIKDGKYVKTGDYNITFTVTDEEGNEVSTTSVLHIVRADTTNTGDESTHDTIALSLDGDTAYSENEHITHTDEELIELFNIESNADETGVRTLTVNQSAIDYEVPGDYDVIFTLTDNFTGETKSITGTYTVIDVLPTISSSDVTVYLGDDNINIMTAFGVTSTEFATDDILNTVTYTGDENFPIDEATNTFNVTGDYPITFTSTDSDGNTVESTSTLHVLRSIDGDETPIDNNQDVKELELTGDSAYSENEHITHTDAELIDLFNIESNADDTGFRTLTVDQSAINYEVPGDYDVIFTITDSISGETKTITCTYTVIDVLPTITSEDITVKLHSDELEYKTALTPIATEFTENDLFESITFKSSVPVDADGKYNQTGDFPVVFTATDSDGNTVESTSIVTVEREISNPSPIDNTADVVDLEIIANENAHGDEENPLSDEELLDLFDVTSNGDDEYRVVTVDQSEVDYSTPGDYNVTFTITDTISGESKDVVVTYTVDDVLPTISSDPEITVTLGDDELSDYIDSFNSVGTEITDGDLTDKITISGLEDIPVDENGKYTVTGDYPITFTVTDEEGNEVSSSSILHVVRKKPDVKPIDNTADVVELSIKADSNYQENEHITHTDAELIDLFNVESNNDLVDFRTLTVDQSNINYEVPGDYNVIFTITDKISGESKSVVGVYTVIDVLPTLSNNLAILTETVEPDEVDATLKQLKDELNSTATEFDKSDINESIKYDTSNLDLTKDGIYEVFLTATDSDGNEVKSGVVVYVVDTQNGSVEGTTLSIEELFDAFNLTSKSEYLTINESIDYDKPAVYPVTIDYKIPYSYLLENSDYKPSDEMQKIIDALNNNETSVDDNLVAEDDIEPKAVAMSQSISDENSEVSSESSSEVTSEITSENNNVQSDDEEQYLEGTLNASYEVYDVLPTISSIPEITINVGDELDYENDFELIASELKDGDLTNRIKVDYSDLDNQTAGDYNVVFSVEDDEGNVEKSTTVVHVVETPSAPETPAEPKTPKKDETPKKEETPEKDELILMTGQTIKIGGLIAISSAIAIGLIVMLKRK